MRSTLSVLDSLFIRAGIAAIFLREERDEVAVIEAGARGALPVLLAALAERGRHPEEVRYVVVTHAHLDHAGGASALLAALPRASLVAHPRAARHLIDPSKLEASARKVYGDEGFARLYGALPPVSAERVLTPEDGGSLPFGGGTLTFLHTRGHAKHHFCVLDPAAEAVYTGDAFGLAYPELQARGTFVFPSSSPTDFEGEEALASVDRIAGCGARRAMLTHFGELEDLGAARDQLRGHLTYSMGIREDAGRLAPEGRASFLLARLRERYAEALAQVPEDFLEMDLRLNAEGLAWSLLAKDRPAAS